jgi:hypothetical protein
MRLARTVLALAAAAPFAATAYAESTAGPVTLAWSAPPECPREDAVLAEVQAALGPKAGTERPVTARAVVTRAGRGFRVTLTTLRDGAPGERVLEDEACDALARATALIVVLTVDPSRAASLGAPTPTPSPTPTPTPAPTPTPTLTPTPRRESLAVFAAGTFDDGTLAAPAFGAGVAIAWLPHPFRLELGGAIFATTRASIPNGEGGTFSLISGGGRACAAFTAGAVELGPCAGFDLAAVHAEGFGADQIQTGNGLWGVVSAGGDAYWSLVRPLGLRLRIDGVLPTARPPFVVITSQNETIQVHRPAPVGLRAAFGVEARFL